MTSVYPIDGISSLTRISASPWKVSSFKLALNAES